MTTYKLPEEPVDSVLLDRSGGKWYYNSQCEAWEHADGGPLTRWPILVLRHGPLTVCTKTSRSVTIILTDEEVKQARQWPHGYYFTDTILTKVAEALGD